MEKLYVLGHPVAHSKSPAMYSAVYEALGLDWSYGFMDCETEDDARAFLDARDFISINITTPYKPLAFSQAKTVTSSAALAHGANVLIKHDGEFVADNTDGIGCVAYLKRRGVVFEGARVVVCGTGPTSRAIMHACALAGARSIALLGRSSERTKMILDEYKSNLYSLGESGVNVLDSIDPRYANATTDEIIRNCSFVAMSYDEASEVISSANLIIDATSLGMKTGDPAPFDVSLISANQTVFDVVYAHGVTSTIAGANAAGARAFDGEGMLVAQAVATVHDVASALSLDVDVDSIDLFAVMAAAAGFDKLAGADV